MPPDRDNCPAWMRKKHGRICRECFITEERGHSYP
jgi:hypothetical protein